MPEAGALDEPDRLSDADPDGYLRELAAGGAHLRRAVAETDAGRLEDDPPRAVVLIGAPSASRAVLALSARPVAPMLWLAAEAGLPRWLGATDMVIALSASGDDAPVLAAADDAGSRGARLVGACPTGTPLAAVVAHARGALAQTPPPAHHRTAFWPLVAGAACGAGLLPRSAADAAADCLDEIAVGCRPDRDSVVNPAKQLAIALSDAAPVLWTSSALTHAAAGRFVEMADAAGQPVAARAFDAGAGLGLLGGPYAPVAAPDDIFRDPVDEPSPPTAHLVVLEDSPSPDGLRGAVDGLARFRVGVTELAPDPGLTDPLARLAYFVGTLDFTAAYLAVLNGVDPGRRLDTPLSPPR